MTNTLNTPIASRNACRSTVRQKLQRTLWAGVGAWAFCMGTAQADTWFFVDDDGVLHYAAERVDERYHRFSMSPLAEDDGPLLVDVRKAAQELAQVSEVDRSATERYFARSKGYQLHGKHIERAAQRHGVDAQLLKAIATAESGFNAGAVSPKGAIGLMQVIPDTAVRFGVQGDAQRSIAQKLKDPAVNVPVSARYVRYLQSLFPGRTDLVLAAYNAGEGAVQRYGNKIPPYKETQNYVKTVMRLYSSLQPTVVASASSGSAPSLYGGNAQLVSSPVSEGRLRMTLPAAGEASPP